MQFKTELKAGLIAMLLFIAGSPAFALSTYTWTGSTTSNWASTASWGGANVPTALAGGTATENERINVNGSAMLVYGTTTGSYGSGYTILAPDAGTRALVIGSGSANGYLSIVSGGTLDTRASITSATTDVADVIANSSYSGTLSIDGGAYINTFSSTATSSTNTLSASGTLILGFAGTGTGVLNINSGSAFISNVSVGGGYSTGIINLNGGTLAVGYIGDSSSTGTSTINFNGGTYEALKSATLTGLDYAYIQAGGALINTNGYNVTFSQSLLAGSTTGGGLAKYGAGTLTLGSANTYTGTTAVYGDTLLLANSAALQYSTLDYNGYGGSVSFSSATTTYTFGGLGGSQTLALVNTAGSAVALTVGNNNLNTTYSGALTGIGSLTKVGSGTLTLSGANTFTGNTNVNAGTLLLTTSSALVGTTNVNAGSVSITDGLALQNSVVSLNNLGGVLSFGSLTSVTLGGLAGSQSLALANAVGSNVALSVGSSVNSSYYGSLTGNGSLTKIGTGTFYVNGNNSYTGLTTVSAGVLVVKTNTGLGTTDNGTVVSNGATLQLQNNVTISGESLSITGSGAGGTLGVLDSSSGSNTWTGSIAVAGSTVNRITCDADLLTLSGNITLATPGTTSQLVFQGFGTILVTGNISGGDSSTSVTRSSNGTGTVIFAGNNTYAGTTLINGGTLQVGNGGTTGNIPNTNVSNSGSLVFNRADAYTYTGVISGSGNVSQSGLGTLTLTGANTYTGATTINAGRLALSSTSSLASTTFVFGGSSTASAVFDVSAKASDYSLASLYGVGSVLLANSTKTLTLTSTINHTGLDSIAITGGLTFAGSASNTYEISLTDGTCDSTSLSGALNYNGTSLVIAFSGVTTANGTYTYDILNFGSETGAASVSFTGLTDGESAAYDATTGIVTLTVVPEPSSLALLAVAFGLVAYAWRKRKNN